MRIFLSMAAIAMLAMALASCGTARALVGDYKDDAVVEDIRPTAGVSGETVTFQALCCLKPGQTDPNYIWDFGGAAFPATSFEKEPQVVLRAGQAAAYNASLTLSGGCLGENLRVTYPFQINVAPLSILAVTGTTGTAGSSAVFSVVVETGVAKKFAWDFGGACSPSGSTADSPSVTFTDVPGTYAGSVIVSNDFEAVTQNFTITVL